jgi:glycosyltransferase involved in cell wall biosynthesis
VKIIFLCGSLEPGRDGVGDYCLTLAAELCLSGHLCLCISINDRWINHSSLHCDNNLSLTHSSVRVIRLSSSDTWNQKRLLLCDIVRDFQPDWFSLQYVPYSYHLKGLPFSLPRWLSHFADLAPWHLMAHELWVHPREKASNLVISSLQKAVLHGLLYSIAPSVIHTSNSTYIIKLRRLGISAGLLRLFSNIPVQATLDASRSDHGTWVFVFFGSLHKEWSPDTFFKSINKASEASGISRCVFNLVGNLGSYVGSVQAAARSLLTIPYDFNILGSQPEASISLHLKAADFGVTTTPSGLIGKSGSVAAMLAHGLPVIVPRAILPFLEWRDTYACQSQFILLDEHFQRRLSERPRFEVGNHLSQTAGQFIDALQHAL